MQDEGSNVSVYDNHMDCLCRWLKKKMTDVMVTKAKFNDGKQIDGVITCDKVGEVKFIGMDRLISEGVK